MALGTCVEITSQIFVGLGFLLREALGYDSLRLRSVQAAQPPGFLLREAFAQAKDPPTPTTSLNHRDFWVVD